MTTLNFINKTARTKVRTIHLNKDAIRKEIEQIAYKLAETGLIAAADQSGNNAAQDAIAVDTDDRLDAALINSFMASRDNELREMLAFCLEDIDSQPDFTYVLRLPENYRASRIRTVLRQMHEFMVKGTLLNWYMKLGTAYGQTMVEDVADLKHRILDTLRNPSFVSHPRIAYQASQYRR